MPNLEKHFYEFGPFHIYTQERVLYRGEEMIPLTPKAVDTLLVLIASRERVIDKDELLKSVWPDTYVEEGALAKNVSALRKALAGGTDEYIATVHKRGYRFVAAVRDLAPVKDVPTSVPGPNPRKWFKRLVWVIPAVLLILLAVPAYRWFVGLFPAGTRRIMSLAVLPLDNPSKDAAQEYFTEGMHEELINTLEKIEALRVISRTSAMIYKGAHKPLPQIARELNVDAIVEGSVLLPEKRVRITVALFEGKTEKQLWAQSYERDLRDVLALQAEVASAIAREIQVKLTSPREAAAGSNPPGRPGIVSGVLLWTVLLEQTDARRVSEGDRVLSARHRQGSHLCPGPCRSGRCPCAFGLDRFRCSSSKAGYAQSERGGIGSGETG